MSSSTGIIADARLIEYHFDERARPATYRDETAFVASSKALSISHGTRGNLLAGDGWWKQRRGRRRRRSFKGSRGASTATASSIIVFILSFHMRKGVFLIESIPSMSRFTCEVGFYYRR